MTELRRYRSLVSDSALWARFSFRDDDIVISTPVKCGTTWMQMLCALLIFDSSRFPRPLTEISPWLDAVTYDVATTLAVLDAQQHRRFIKSHIPLDGLPRHGRVTYICVGRDPRDAFLSLEHAFANLTPVAVAEANAAAGVDPQDFEPPPNHPVERFWLWAESEFANSPRAMGATLANLLHHMRTFWDRRSELGVVLFHFSDLLADLPGQLRRLAGVLSIDTPDDRIEELAAAATFANMRERADDLAPGADMQLWQSNRAFFRAGSNGQWRDLLSPADVDRYKARVAELAPPDLADWVHTGWLG